MKKHRKDLKSKKGITLIALVVTIVVLLILAGITISTLFGDNGIISAARKAADDTTKDQTNTEQGLQNLVGQMADAMDSSGLMNLINSKAFVTGKNQVVSDRTGKTMIVPIGFKIAEDSSNEIDKGVVIEDKIGNQYVWVPVSDSQFNDMFGSIVSGSTTNYFGKLYNFTTTGKSSPMQSAIGSTSGYREPDILTDTTYGDAVTEDSTKGIEQLKSVVGITADSNATDTNQNILDKWNNQLQTKFNEMAKSVKEYKGFYIGRYELSGLSNSNPTTTIPKVVRGANPSNYVNWYNMYREIQNIETYTNSDIQSDVKTNMIWGCQWDRTLDWIANTDSNIGYAGLKSSTSWGNYKDATFEYKATSGATTTTTKAKNSSTKIPTGSTERNKANNIYDLAGNLWEWTMEANGASLRADRGGLYYISGSSGPVSTRNAYDPFSGNYDIGSRPTLYVTLPAGSNP